MHDSTKFALNYEEKDISLANLSSTGKKPFQTILVGSYRAVFFIVDFH